MKNIAIIVNSLGAGGAERVGVTVAKYLKRRKNKVYIMRYVDKYEDYDVSDIDDIFTFPKHPNPFVEIVNQYFAYARYIKSKKIDDVIVLGVGDVVTYLYRRFHSKPKLILSQRNDPKSEYDFSKLVKHRVIKYLDLADDIVFQTNDAQAYFEPYLGNKGHIILNPLKEDLPRPFLGERSKEIVNFCRLHKQKNLPLLFDAFKIIHQKYPEYTLTVFGRGPLRDELLNYIQAIDMKESIKITDFEKNIHSRILKAAMFVSSSDFEGVSNSMLESMAIGLPVICTDCPCGGARMVIDSGENGILVPVQDVKALANAMQSVIEDKEYSEKLAKNATCIRERLAVDNICRMWEDLI